MNAVESGSDGCVRRDVERLEEIKREMTRPYCGWAYVSSNVCKTVASGILGVDGTVEGCRGVKKGRTGSGKRTMAITPAMTVGMHDLIMSSGRKTEAAMIPMPDLAVPYEAPKQARVMAEVQPMAEKKGCEDGRCQCYDKIKIGVALVMWETHGVDWAARRCLSWVTLENRREGGVPDQRSLAMMGLSCLCAASVSSKISTVGLLAETGSDCPITTNLTSATYTLPCQELLPEAMAVTKTSQTRPGKPSGAWSLPFGSSV